MRQLTSRLQLKWALASLFFWLSLSACTWKDAPRGSAENPIQVSLVPSKDTLAILHDAEDFSKWMEKETGLKFKITIPSSYIAVVEGLGGKRVDLAYLNTTTYFMAQEKYGAEVRFIGINSEGQSKYKGQILVRADSPIKTLEDLQGKKIAYVDPTSASGYILAAALLKSKNIKPSQEVFAGKHDSVVMMIYQKQVDAGATFYAVPENGKPMDARRLVQTQYPDVWEKIRVLGYTDSLANDAFVFRKDLAPELKDKITAAMEKWISTAEGKATLKSLSNASGLRRVTDKDYEESRKILQQMSEVLHAPAKK